MKRRILILGLAAWAAGTLAAEEVIPPGHIALSPDGLAWTPVPPSLPAGASSALLEGHPGQPGIFTIRIQLPAGYLIPPHTHPEAERVTVLSGSVHVGFGEKVDRAQSRRFGTGSFYVNPAGAPHFVWTDAETTLQVTAQGPWQFRYLNPGDEPGRH